MSLFALIASLKILCEACAALKVDLEVLNYAR
jgi:hypothetical protein